MGIVLPPFLNQIHNMELMPWLLLESKNSPGAFSPQNIIISVLKVAFYKAIDINIYINIKYKT